MATTHTENLKWRLRNLFSCFLPLCVSQLGNEGLGSREECCPSSTTCQPDIGKTKKKGNRGRYNQSHKDRSSRVSDITGQTGGCIKVAEDDYNWSRYLEEDYIVFCFDVSNDRDTKALTMTRTTTGISSLIDKKEEEEIDLDPMDDKFEGSNRSFTFPVLRCEPLGSPDYMPKHEETGPRIRSRSARVHCCKF